VTTVAHVRVLFVCGTSDGGSARSTEQLGARLHGRGHDVAMLMGRRPRPLPRQLDGAARTGLDAVVARQARRVERVIGRRLSSAARGSGDASYPTWQSRFPGPCLPAVGREHRPDVVVATSLDRRTWRTVHAHLAAAGMPSVLYLRAESTVAQLAAGPLPDLVLANARSLADAAAALGVNAVVVPSVVELDRGRVESTRQRVLFVNPIARRGLPIALAMARARPRIPFVIQETAPLDGRDRARLRGRVDALTNVAVRSPVSDPAALYRDARILLAPYLVSNRPRVVLEAQSNAIPVLAADVPGLRECVPPGGVLVRPEAPLDEWLRALDELWDDPGRYAQLAAAARRHSERADVQPSVVVDRFEEALASLLPARAQRPRARS
jgi:glycosyltransferase involved in cell wall biosynthesis